MMDSEGVIGLTTEIVKNVVSGIYQCSLPTGFPIGDVHVYLITDQDGLTLVDAGAHRDDGNVKLQQAIADLGYQISDVHTIILTHGHADHVGNVNTLTKLSGARVVGHELTQTWLSPTDEWLQKEDQFFHRLYAESGLSEEEQMILRKERQMFHSVVPAYDLDDQLKEGEKIGDFTVLFTPGHSNSSIALYREKDHVLIAGDVLIDHVSSNAFVEPDPLTFTRIPSVKLFHDTFHSLLDLKLNQVLSGHGIVISDPHALIRLRLEMQTKRVAQLIDQIKEGHHSVRQLAQALFPGRMKELMLIVSEIVGHLDLAIERGLVKQAVDDHGMIRYEIASNA